MENRLEILRLEIDRLIQEKQAEKNRHFYSHLYGVSHFCTLLAIRRNLNPEIAATGTAGTRRPLLRQRWQHSLTTTSSGP